MVCRHEGALLISMTNYHGNNRGAASTLTSVVSLSGISDMPPLCFTLLACPFCCAVPRLVEQAYVYGFSIHEDGEWDVACGTAGCYLENGAGWNLTQEGAAALWNNRSSSSVMQIKRTT